MNRFEISKKYLILISLFLLIFIVGTILILIIPIGIKTTYGRTVKTSDGEIISFNVFEPKKGGTNKKAVIIGHGVMSNKEMMKGYAIELAAAGFVAIPFDFRGHGQSSGELKRDRLIYDIQAIISYVNSRVDINSSALGYLGFSMGGFPGIEIVNQSANFKCFVGAGTRLPTNVRIGNSSDPLNILMIVGRYDEAITVRELKEGLSDRVGLPSADIDVNKLYGSFQDGNASMIYLDDTSNHVLGIWDPDFIREARNFVMNTFPDVKAVDENFFVNIRFLILGLQIIGGVGFFFLIIPPLSKFILNSKQKDRVIIEIENESVNSTIIKTIFYSIVLGIPGVIIFIPIFIILPLAIAGFVSTLLFGQMFGILILLYKLGKKENLTLLTIIKKPFISSKEQLVKQILLGAILAVIFYLILYLSIGLNYLGMVPAPMKTFWVPIYFMMFFFINIIFGLLFHGVIQNKVGSGRRNLIKVSLMIFGFLFLNIFSYLFILAIIMKNFFYFGTFLPVAIPILLSIAFSSTLIYQKSGNVIAGAIVSSFFLTLVICTLSPYQNGLSFVLGFFH
ncbi:MAG: alpha/beta hydrolase [Promethearchaeota archaeon]